MRRLFRELVIAKERRTDEAKRDVAHAWYVAAFSRQKTLQKLDRILGSLTPPRVEPIGHQRMMLEMLSARYGIPLGKTNLIPKHG